jgi:hypothetical protein
MNPSDFNQEDKYKEKSMMMINERILFFLYIYERLGKPTIHMWANALASNL